MGETVGRKEEMAEKEGEAEKADQAAKAVRRSHRKSAAAGIGCLEKSTALHCCRGRERRAP
eukprot:4721207-Pleurochrysis_carterae.AAC.1